MLAKNVPIISFNGVFYKTKSMSLELIVMIDNW